jgi:GNAT superfamily N-acetyltransferase
MMKAPTMLQINPYQPRHLEITARLWLDSFLSSGVAVAGDVTFEELAARIPTESEWLAFLAWEGDTLVGFLALKPVSACLDQIFILPSAQGRGIGAVLLDFAKARLPDGMWLGTAAENTGARRFYERHGFRLSETGVHPRRGHPWVTYRWP